jgi:hypothetical protein
MREKSTNTPIINYVRWLLQVSTLHCHPQGAFLVPSERRSIEEQSTEYCGWACCVLSKIARWDKVLLMQILWLPASAAELFWVITHRVVTISHRRFWPLKVEVIGCPETPVKNYHYMMLYSPEWRSSHAVLYFLSKLVSHVWGRFETFTDSVSATALCTIKYGYCTSEVLKETWRKWMQILVVVCLCRYGSCRETNEGFKLTP